MRRKIAKRKRKECLQLGAVIESEGWIKGPGWKRKEAGYSITAKHNGWGILCGGFDELEAYKSLLWVIRRNGEEGEENHQRGICS